VKCGSDDADVTDVNNEDLVSRALLPSWELIVTCSGASTSLLADTSGTSTPTEGVTVEVKIGITESSRELVFSSPQTPSEVEELVGAALREGSGGLLRLSDDKGRRFLIQTTKIAYVEIGVADARRVGFGIGGDPAGKSGGKAAKSE
jgi:hypothetical protein